MSLDGEVILRSSSHDWRVINRFTRASALFTSSGSAYRVCRFLGWRLLVDRESAAGLLGLHTLCLTCWTLPGKRLFSLFRLTDDAVNHCSSLHSQAGLWTCADNRVFQLEVEGAVGCNVPCHFHYLGGDLAEEGISSIAQRFDFFFCWRLGIAFRTTQSRARAGAKNAAERASPHDVQGQAVAKWGQPVYS
jgi:hypothetical protein